MSNNKKSSEKTSNINEEEIFKFLAHNVRRDIIKEIGMSKELLFSEIQKRIKSIDSPTLSYHLKSLEPLLKYNNKKYELSEIGKSAYNLLFKIDQHHKYSHYKKRFFYAYFSTVLVWIIIQIVIPLIVYHIVHQFDVFLYFTFITINIIVLSVINYIVLWKLKNK